MVNKLPETRVSRVILDQLLRSGTAVGANYRALCRAKSEKDFINKLKMIEEEADESLNWIDLLIESKLVTEVELKPIRTEADELLRIFVAALKTSRERFNLRIPPKS